jgi:hypothetical protein
VTVLAVDSTIPGRGEGRLDDATLAWLRAELAQTDRPTFVALHHAPVPLQHPLPDAIGLTNPDDLAAVLAGSPDVVGLLAGHAHLAAASSFAGVPLRVGPGITWSLRMPWDGMPWDGVPSDGVPSDGVPSDGEGVPDLTQPPAVAFHVLDGDPRAGGRLTTHYRAVV